MSLKVNPLIDVCHIAAENNSEVLFRQITLWNKGYGSIVTWYF